MSSPLHGRVRVGAGTAPAQFAASPIVPGALAPAWRRAARPLGTLGVRQGRPPARRRRTAPGALARLNSGALSVVPAPAAPPAGATGAAIRLGDLAGVFTKVSVTPDKLATVTRPPGFAVLTWRHPGPGRRPRATRPAPAPADLRNPSTGQAGDPVGPVDADQAGEPVGPAQPVDPLTPASCSFRCWPRRSTGCPTPPQRSRRRQAC